MTGTVRPTTAKLHLSAQTFLLSEPVRWWVTGLAGSAPVVVRSEMRVGASVWAATATFAADVDGTVDPAQQAPTRGSYAEADPGGLLWSMLPRSGQYDDVPGRAIEPLDVDLHVEQQGIQVADAHFRRLIVSDAVVRRPLREGGLVGTLFAPVDGAPRPGVLVLGGSEGGLIESYAAALAGEGFAALALAYFGVDGLPSQLSMIPLEYFGRALRWMQTQPEVDGARIAVAGASKGGEAALLIGSTYEDIAAVVGVVPSGVAFMSIGRSPLGLRRSSWSKDGGGAPFVGAGYTWPLLRELVSRRPLQLRVFYEEAIKNEAAVTAGAIPVERINGPVLLLSGADDRLWPSAVLADIAERRLTAHNHRWPHEHVSYPDCGHAFGLPFMPALTEIPHAFLGRSVMLGGTRSGTARAAVAGWRKVCDFLHESLS